MGSQHAKSAGPQAVVAVCGASGHTGKFVVAELWRRGFTPIAIGRDEAKLAAAGYAARGVVSRVARLEDPQSLDHALAGAAAVINCAGPFLDTAEPVIEAALRAGVHYLDVTAEQPSALATFERFAAPARDAGVIVLPAMGFYGGLGDLLATAAMGDWRRADEIRIGIALDGWWPTQGTRRTGLRNTARRCVIAAGALAPLADPAPTTSWTFAEPFGVQVVVELPFTETILIGHHLHVSDLHTYLNTRAIRDVRDPATPPPVAADESGRSAQTFLVDVMASHGSDRRRATARGRDIYAFTAPLIVAAVERVLAAGTKRGGAFAPGELFDAEQFLKALGSDTVIFECGPCAT